MLVTRPDGLVWMPRRGCCSCCWGTGTSPRPDDPGTPKKSVKSLRAVIEISLLKIISSKWEKLHQLLFGERALRLNLLIVKHRRFEINFFIFGSSKVILHFFQKSLDLEWNESANHCFMTLSMNKLANHVDFSVFKPKYLTYIHSFENKLLKKTNLLQKSWNVNMGNYFLCVCMYSCYLFHG